MYGIYPVARVTMERRKVARPLCSQDDQHRVPINLWSTIYTKGFHTMLKLRTPLVILAVLAMLITSFGSAAGPHQIRLFAIRNHSYQNILTQHAPSAHSTQSTEINPEQQATFMTLTGLTGAFEKNGSTPIVSLATFPVSPFTDTMFVTVTLIFTTGKSSYMLSYSPCQVFSKPETQRCKFTKIIMESGTKPTQLRNTKVTMKIGNSSPTVIVSVLMLAKHPSYTDIPIN